MRLGFILTDQPNAYYRAIFPMQCLAERGHTIVNSHDTSRDVPLGKLAGCDLVHCHRRHDRVADLRELSRHGVAVSFDNDDDFGASDMLDGKSTLEGLRGNRRYATVYLAAAKLADLVTTPSPVLAEKYRAAGAENVVVIDNYLFRGHIQGSAGHSHEHLTVGLVASSEHAVDLERIPVADALSRLLDEHPRVRVMSVGVRLPLHTERYAHTVNYPLPRLIEATAQMDIGIAPLVDSAFNRARSTVKLKEYGAGGAAWLASPVGPYLGLGAKQGGRLVEDRDWFEALDELVRKPRLRRRLARRSLRWANDQTIDRHASTWEQAFEGAIARARERMVAVHVPQLRGSGFQGRHA
jgi:glycosyltransferase involved in cell wall biosynthesis